MRAFTVAEAECEKLGGRFDPEEGCLLEELTYGEPSYLYGKSRGKWLPSEVQKKFWLANFSKDKTTSELAETQLNGMGVVEVEGSIHFPLEPCRYSKLYRHKSVIFVPKVCETNSVKFMKFRAVALRVLIPLNTELTLKEGI